MKELLGTRAVREWLASGGAGPVAIQGANLDELRAELAGTSLRGAILLGCPMAADLRNRLQDDGASVVPDFGVLPRSLGSFPTTLYTVADLYAGFDPGRSGSWIGSPDHEGWSFFMKDAVTPNSLTIAESAAARLHDTAIERAIARLREDHGKPSIAIMGGHDVKRTAPAFRQVVQIARDLRRKGYLIVTGGGPGLMEAGNLGAFLAAWDDDAIDKALQALPEVGFQSHEWLASGARVRALFNQDWRKPVPEGATSLAIPTWLYGHEPPNFFASHIGKMFYNSLREDGLVTVANGGIVFGPGNAGTVQEIFQDITQNYYRGALSATPMVFLDPAYWSRPGGDELTFPPKKNPGKPLLPLVRQLAAEKDFLSSILVSDDVGEIVRFLDRMPAPVAQEGGRIGDVRLRAQGTSTEQQRGAA